MKKVYQKIVVRTVALSPDGTILTGSVTDVPIQMPAEIPVKEFENGFDDGDFEINF